MAIVGGKSAVERLEEKFEALRAAGLRDLKVSRTFTEANEATAENLAEEILAIIEAIEKGMLLPLGDKLK